jgi:Ala-tRNA(Pro) deacylase
MPTARLQTYLQSQGIHYTTLRHSLAFTAREVAATTHTPLKDMAKTVIVKVDGHLAMAVLPAPLHVDLEMLEVALDARRVRLATESEFRNKFPDCETGAMPPFGNLYGIPVYVDESLTRDEEIALNAGSHREAIRIAYADFAALVKPRVLKFAASGPRYQTA